MATSILADFRYVEVKSDTALIDSRVYCREVIEVDHAPWVQNVLYKYQTDIESRFGRVYFENRPVLTEDGVINATEIYAMLTEEQCNACLTLSKNLTKTVQAKLNLVEDFARAKAHLKAQLQRQFESPATPQYPASDRNFCNSIYKVQAMSGIKSISAIKKAIIRDFVEGVDYKFFGKLLCVNDPTYYKLAVDSRSSRGANKAMLPGKLEFFTDDYFKPKKDVKKNSRLAKASEGIQLELDLSL